MAIPSYQSIMLPLLSAVADGKVHKMRDLIHELSDHYALTEAERTEVLPSGNKTFGSRAYWARTYLMKAQLIQQQGRAHIQITERGKDVLAKNPSTIDVNFLKQFPEFVEYYSGPTKDGGGEGGGAVKEPEPPETPDEMLLAGHEKLKNELESDLLARVKASSPEFFEWLVVKLLTTMGYGGLQKDAGTVMGGPGDGGIDAVIKEDKLGLDMIYLQAKRWGNASVGRPDVQAFVGALAGNKARKGIFLTTSTFTKQAEEYAADLDVKVVLIDGERLAQLMWEYGIGVTTEHTYEVKRIDSDFFDDADDSENTTAAATN